VCAVPAAGVAELDAALDAQERAPDVRAAALGEAIGTGAAWLWVLEGTAVPRPPALAALLDAAQRLEPLCAPLALTSRIVDGGGALARAHVPLAPHGETEVAVRTAALRVLPVRAMTGGSLLVRREALAARPARDEPALVWTARLLRDGPGFLVPDSVAEALGADGAASVNARLLLGAALRPSERIRFAVELFERGLGAVRR